MKWSWKMGRILGIDVYIHATFLLLIGWIVLSHWMADRSLAATLAGVWFVLLVFGSVLLHEFGHALAARRYGIPTRDITLLPIGGLARLERMPEDPRQELWVALAGPAVNVAIAAALYLWLAATGLLAPLADLSVTAGPLLERLMITNLWLVGFNLLPAFPMDGGRVLRALLATRMEYTHATQLAATVGQGMALLFGLVGLFSNPFLLFIALFVWIGAAQEAGMVQMKSSLAGIPVRRVMITDFDTLHPGDPLQRAVDLVLGGFQQDFPVVEDGRAVGILTRSALIQALSTDGLHAPVGHRMTLEFETAEANEMLDPAFARLQACGCHTAVVLHEGRVAGLLTMDNLGEFVMIQSAMK
ncbi:MAG TPA: site-2 protease family protein [Longimicrobiales bacterium]|nr:site-2 protease family protein [Longimicrobiales bacterium]